jgi:hypothetical protein
MSRFSVTRGEKKKGKKKRKREKLSGNKIPRFDKFPKENLQEGRLKSAYVWRRREARAALELLKAFNFELIFDFKCLFASASINIATSFIGVNALILM